MVELLRLLPPDEPKYASQALSKPWFPLPKVDPACRVMVDCQDIFLVHYVDFRMMPSLREERGVERVKNCTGGLSASLQPFYTKKPSGIGECLLTTDVKGSAYCELYGRRVVFFQGIARLALTGRMSLFMSAGWLPRQGPWCRPMGRFGLASANVSDVTDSPRCSTCMGAGHAGD